VTGIATAGNRLSALSGTWAGAGPIAYAFQWYRCDAAGAHCSSIRGATAASYRLVRRDAGKTIGLAVAATDSSGSSNAYASLVGPISGATPLVESTVQPEVSGAAIVGKPLSVSTGAWSPTPTKLTYSWARCNANGRVCAAIPGATQDSYTVAPADVGHALLVVVQATFGATTQSALSTASDPAAAPDVIGPVNVLLPSVTGVQAQGAQLRGSRGIWTGMGDVTYAYQWYRCDGTGAHCLAVRGATKPTYRLVARDAGRTIGLTVRATDSTGTAGGYASLVGPIATVHAPEEARAQPSITGDANAGQKLSVSNGAWSPAPTSTSYAWLRCNANGRVCTTIEGAASPTYTATVADTGHRLVAVVTAATSAGSQASLSVATAPVA
jgi:hypothetical protein